MASIKYTKPGQAGHKTSYTVFGEVSKNLCNLRNTIITVGDNQVRGDHMVEYDSQVREDHHVGDHQVGVAIR